MDVIIYHNADPDGIFSGAIALKAHPNAITIGYNYEPDFTPIIDQCHGKNVVMVDVSPKNWADMHRLCEAAKSVTWIDHHLSALREMEVNNTPLQYPYFTCVFEHEKWGAAKNTWEYFFPGQTLPKAIEYVAAYDAFRAYGSYDWDAHYFPFRFATGMIDTPQEALYDFAFNDELDADFIRDYLARGRAIAQYLDHDNAYLVHSPDHCHDTLFRHGETTYRVLAINRGLFGDMFKSRDLTDFDFVVGFYRTTTGWKVSLRSAGKDIDLGAIAKTFGGGGHKDAAGFSVETFEDLRNMLFVY